ncbi:hypothetical protein KY315_02545 [Candidatus Woesearchaeota archaeon]|nr:hypothetical protein [Candidatus Woesearchaeota archaeon]
MSELTDIVAAAIPIFAGAHVVSTIGRAYVRYKLTEYEYPHKPLRERLPRCVAKRIFRPTTLIYTSVLGTTATLAYHILRNI